ncbi:uncharacterized protein LOC129320126 [Prosopis cineraria]|uniref:uncharacterized protein LOC129320126 n=1 Tax=Prosopis cineraria TaxID=364024 RepID=UPI00240EC9E4|nr:uncharacterized protein LOC129320126 [Prosopis cineraria]
MDKKWMSANHLSKEYWDGVAEFVKFVVNNAKNHERIVCPCLSCRNVMSVSLETCELYLFKYEIDQSYKYWVKHGETPEDVNNSSQGYMESCSSPPSFDTNANEADCLEELIDTIEEELENFPEKLERLKTNAETPLYEGCIEFTLLSAVLELYNLKETSGWSDTSFSSLLSLIKLMLSKNNKLPGRLYDAKKVLRIVSLSYKKMHACLNNCILFRNEYEELTHCPKCETSCYKQNGKSAKKAMWYFPIILRFRHLYSIRQEAKNLKWHTYGRIKDDKIRHPANSPEWIRFDRKYPEFGKKDRNLRLALSTDGMNPHDGWVTNIDIVGGKSLLMEKKEERPPKQLTGEELFEKVKDLDIEFGKLFAKHVGISRWKKRSIFFEFPYWKTLNVRHFLELMHIEKNVCDSLVGMLLHILGKTKDGINARLDMVEMGVRGELASQEKRTCTFLQAATHTLSRKEKKSLCEFLATIKVLHGYSSNVRNLVSMKDL